MPFVSQAQRRFMFAEHPDIAKRWATLTPKGADLPEHVKGFADGGTVMMPPLGAPPERPPIQATPQPLALPGVSYKPYKPNPRTTRSLVRRSMAISTPQFRLGGGGHGAGADRFSPLGTSPMFGLGADQGLPGLGLNTQPSYNPDDQYQGLPGFAGGGVVRFADGGDVDYGDPNFYGPNFMDMTLEQIAQTQDDERRRQQAAAAAQEAQAQAFNPAAIEQGRRDYQAALNQQQAANEMAQLQQQPFLGQPQQGGEQPGVTQPGTLLGQLQAQRYNPNDPTAGNVAPDAAQQLLGASATALPMIAFGPVAGAAGWGLSAAAEEYGAPAPVQTLAQLAPYFVGGIATPELATQSPGEGFPLGITTGTGGMAETLARSGQELPGLGTRLLQGAGGLGGSTALITAAQQSPYQGPNVPGFGPVLPLLAGAAGGMAGEAAVERFQGSQMAQSIGQAATELHVRLNDAIRDESGMVRLGRDYGTQRVEPGEAAHPSETAPAEAVHPEEDLALHLRAMTEGLPGTGTATPLPEVGPERTPVVGAKLQEPGPVQTAPPNELSLGAQRQLEAMARAEGRDYTTLPAVQPGGEVQGPGFSMRPTTPEEMARQQTLDQAVENFRRTGQLNVADLMNSREPLRGGLLPAAGPAPAGLLPSTAEGVPAGGRVPTAPVQGEGFTASAPYSGRQAPEFNPLDLGHPRTDLPPSLEDRIVAVKIGPDVGGNDMGWTPVMPMSDVLAEADRLGVKYDPGILERGMPGVKQAETQRVLSETQAALDRETAANAAAASDALLGRQGRAEENVFQTFRQDRVQQAAAEEAAKQRAWTQQPGGQGGGGGQANAGGGLGRYSGGPGRGGGAGGGANTPSGMNLPTGRVGGIDWNPIHNLFSLIGGPTQPLLTGFHLARFVPQQLPLRPGVFVKGMTALAEGMAKGKAPETLRGIRGAQGNIPVGERIADMYREDGGARQLNRTAVQWMIDHSPVGPVLTRFREGNASLLQAMKEAQYVYSADRLARSLPDATHEMYRDLWQRANTATGHTTIPFLKNSVSSNVGVGLGAFGARLQELAGTVWGSGAPAPWAAGSRAEAFKTMINVAATMGGSAALAKALGAQVNLTDPFNQYGVDSKYLRAVTQNDVFKTTYGLGGAGYDTILKVALRVGNDVHNGDWKGAGTDLLKFGRGEFGVVPGSVIDAILGKDYKNEKYTWQDLLNELKTGYMANQEGEFGKGRSIPIPAQANYGALQAYGPEGLLRALPADIASEATTTPLSRTEVDTAAQQNPDKLAQAFKGNDFMAKQVGQDDIADITTREKAALDAVMTPEQKASMEEHKDHLRRVEDPYQLAADQRDVIRQVYAPAFDKLERDLNSGANAYYVNTARKALQDEMYKEINAVKSPDNNGDRQKSDIQTLVDAYGQLNNIKNFDQRNTAQQAFKDSVKQEYGDDMAKRLEWNVAPQISDKSHPLVQMYQAAQPLTSPYFNIKSDTEEGRQQRQTYLENHVQSNVALSYFYGTPLRTAEAARQYQQEHPQAPREVNIDMGFRPSQAYRTLPQTRDLLTYEALPSGPDHHERADYLSTRPDLNALLYRTGHTSNFYTLQAYDMVFGR